MRRLALVPVFVTLSAAASLDAETSLPSTDLDPRIGKLVNDVSEEHMQELLGW